VQEFLLQKENEYLNKLARFSVDMVVEDMIKDNQRAKGISSIFKSKNTLRKYFQTSSKVWTLGSPSNLKINTH
jgi:hypothetical protein